MVSLVNSDRVIVDVKAHCYQNSYNLIFVLKFVFAQTNTFWVLTNYMYCALVVFLFFYLSFWFSLNRSKHAQFIRSEYFSSFICFSSKITQEEQNLHYNTQRHCICIDPLIHPIQAYIPDSIKMIMIITIIITVVVFERSKQFLNICPTMYGRYVGRLLVSSFHLLFEWMCWY